MKTVFSNAQDCVHAYAQRQQSRGRSSNIFFENDKIYSYGYHYLLGEFIDDNTILINDKGYSSTTNKHIGYVRWGTRQYKQFFTTRCDIILVHRQVLNLKDKLATARKPENYINSILSLFDSLNEFIQYTKSKHIPKDVRYKEIKKIVKAIQDQPQEYKQTLAEAKKKQEQAKKRREQKQIKEQYKSYWEKKGSDIKARRKEKLLCNICDCEITRESLTRHKNSKKHLENITKLNSNPINIECQSKM